MSGKKKMITEKDAERIRKLAETRPRAALQDLNATIAVRAGVAKAKRFSIDAISRGPKRRSPLTQTGTLDQELRGDSDRKSMIATTRDLFLNTAFGVGISRQHVKNMIGPGPRLQATTDDNEFNKRAEDYFNTRKDRLDVRGMSFGRGLRVGEQREIVDGDYGRVIIKGGFTQFVEGDRIADPPGSKKKSNRIYVNGVEMNRAGTPLAYHIYNRGKTQGRMRYDKRVESDNFFHLFRPERFDQARGLPWVVGAVNDMQDLRETLEAAKGKWKIDNLLGVAVTSDLPEADEFASLWGGLTDFATKNQKGNDETRYEVKLGKGVTSFELRPGEKIESIQSKTPNTTFEPMTFLLIRIIALTLDMPLEIALQYFTRGSYSSHRAAFLQYADSIRTRRTEIEETHLDRLYRWMIQRAIKAEVLSPPKNGQIPTLHVWQWPGMGLLDPDKQRKGDTMGYKLGAESLSSITGRDGNFWQDVAAARIREIKWIKELALKEGIDPALVLPSVTMPGEQPAGDTDGNDDGTD